MLDLWNSDWDATAQFPAERRVSLDFRRYHFSGDLTIELDLDARRYRIMREPGGAAPLPSGPLGEAAEAMEASGRRLAARQGGRPLWQPNILSNPWAAWRTALLILGAALLAIVAATVLSLQRSPLSQPEGDLLRSIPSPS